MTISCKSIKDETSQLLKIASPIIATNLVFSATNFFCTLMVARLGETSLAASVIGSGVWVVLSTLFCAVLSSISVLIAHELKDGPQNVAKITQHGALLGAIIIVLFMTLIKCSYVVLKPLIDNPEVYHLVRQYLDAELWCLPGLVLLTIYDQLLIGVGKANIIFKISLLIVPIEILSSACFIFGWLGMPAFNIYGIGYGLGLTFNLTAIGMSIYLWRGAINKELNIFTLQRLNFNYLKEVVRLGLPIGLMQGIEIGALTVTTLLVAKSNSAMLAAHQILIQYFALTLSFLFALAQAISVRVASIAEKNLPSLKHTIYVSISSSALLIGLFILFLGLDPNLLLSVDFNLNDQNNFQLFSYFNETILFLGLVLFFESIRISVFGCLRGLRDTKSSMIISLICFWLIGLSLSYIFSCYLKLELKGAWLGLAVGAICATTLMLLRISFVIKSKSHRETVMTAG